MIKMALFFALLTFGAIGFTAVPTTAHAGLLGPSSTQCVQGVPAPGWQQCTVYHYNSQGEVTFTNVYYINPAGMWVLLPD